MTGDSNDILQRLRALLPPWFPQQGQAAIVDGLLSGIAVGLSFVYSLNQFARQQMRLATATGGWLDLLTWDYFGGRYVRRLTELDASWRLRAVKEILRERNTRSGLVQALFDLTGIAPAVFEPSGGMDTGGYSTPGSIAYGINGGYGSLLLPWTGLVGAFRPSQSGIPNAAGYGIPNGGYGQPSQLSWNDLSQIVGAVTDAEILATIASVRPASVVFAAGISNQVTLIAITDENGVGITDEAGNPIYQD